MISLVLSALDRKSSHIRGGLEIQSVEGFSCPRDQQQSSGDFYKQNLPQHSASSQ